MKKIIGLIATLAMISNGICVSAEETDENYVLGSSPYSDGLLLTEYIDKETEKVIIPDNVEVIGAESFKDCINLKSITIPSSVKVIEKNAFMNCKSLERVEMTNSVEIIEENAFAYCPNLKEFVASANAFRDAVGENMDYYIDIFGDIDEEYPEDIVQPTANVNVSFASFDENTYYITADEINCYPHETYPISIRSDFIRSITFPEYILSLDWLSICCSNIEEIHAESIIYTDENFISQTLNEATIYISDECINDGSVSSVYINSIKSGLNVSISDNITTKIGDINCDGDVDIRDVTSLKKFVVKLTNLNEMQLVNADIVKDDAVDVKDLGQLLKYIIKVITFEELKYDF